MEVGTGASLSATPPVAVPPVPVAGLERSVRAAFVVLVLATFAAFFVMQRLKHEPTLVHNPEAEPWFMPGGTGRGHLSEKISFLLTHADHVTVALTDARGRVVFVLARDHYVPAYTRYGPPRWNGRSAAGVLQPPGIYGVRLTLPARDRTLVIETFKLLAPGQRP